MSPWSYLVTRGISNSSQSNDQWNIPSLACVCVYQGFGNSSLPAMFYLRAQKHLTLRLLKFKSFVKREGSWSKGHLAAASFTNRINAFSLFRNTEKVRKRSGVVRASRSSALKSGTSCWILMYQMSVRGRGQSDLFSLIRYGIFGKPTCKHRFSR